MRKFEEVKTECLKFPGVPTVMPERADARSAGYDFRSKEDCVVIPGESHTFWTDVKAIMFYDNVLQMYTRSGNGVKRGIVLRNGTGVIDASYAGNPDNDGNIGICLVNNGTMDFKVSVGDRIAQGIFMRYLITDDDKYLLKQEDQMDNVRKGGFGSTGK